MVAPKLDHISYRAFFETAAEGMLLVSGKGVVIDANQEACDVLGYRREELSETELCDLLDPADRGAVPLKGCRPAEVRQLELRFVRRDGGSFAAEVSLARCSDGNCANLLSIVFRRRPGGREEGTQPAEVLGEAVVRSGSDLIILCNADNTIRYASPSVERILGYEPEELEGVSIPSLVHPDDRAVAAREARRVLKDRESRTPPLRYRHKDGSWVYLESVTTNLLDDPRVRGIVVNSRNVTEQVRSEREMRELNEGLKDRVAQLRAAISEADDYEQMLRESLETFRTTFDLAAAGIAHVDPGGRWLSVNKKFCEIVGHSRESLLKKTFRDVTHPDDQETALENMRRVLEGEVETCSTEERYLREDGSVVWVHLTVSLVRGPFATPRYLIFVIEDITERKEAEEALRRSEQRLASLVRYASDIILILDADGTILFDSAAVERVLGFKPEEREGTNAFEHLHPDDAETVRNKFARILERPDERISAEYRVRDREGSWHSFEAIGTNLLDDPLIAGIVVNTRDITERKRVERALRESEELYRTVVEQADENVFLIDVETRRVLEANAAFRRSLGYTAEDLEELTLYDIAAHDRENIDHNIGILLEQGHNSVGERCYRCKNGSLVDVEVHANLVPYSGGTAICVVAHDVTERKRMEEDLRRSLDGMVALYEASKVLVSSLDLEEIGPRLLDIIRRAADLSAAVIELRDGQQGPRLLFAAGPESTWRLARESSGARKARRAAVETGQPQSFRTGSPGDGLPPVGLCLPMRVRGRLIGTVEAYGPHTLTDRRMVEFLGSLAGHAGSTFENARLYGDLAERERRLEELLGKLITTQEEERRRVAYEVHDGIAHVAVAAHQRLQDFARRHPPVSDEGEEDLNRALMLVQRAVKEARRVIANLRPSALEDLGLVAAIRLEIEALRGEGWRVEYEENIRDERLPAAMETAVFRVAQEALTNVRKHARTRQARLELLSQDGKLCLKVEDRGIGFDPATSLRAVGPGERVGISGMRERVSLLGGHLEVRNRPGGGTEVVAEIPIPTRPGDDA